MELSDGINDSGKSVDAPLPFSINHNIVTFEDWLIEVFEQLGDCDYSEAPDKERPTLKVVVSEQLVTERRLESIFSSFYNMEYWYQYLSKGMTAITEFISLNSNDIKNILDRTPSRALIERVQDVINRINTERAKTIERSATESGCFIRLNSLSPKCSGPVSSAQQALTVIADTPRTSNKLSDTSMNHSIAVRQFIPNMDETIEFRCFIHSRQVRAISYYDEKIADQELCDMLISHRFIIKKSIYQFLKRVVSEIDYYDFVADVLILGKEIEAGKDELTVTLMELNPPVYYETSSGYFSVQLDSELLWGPTNHKTSNRDHMKEMEFLYGTLPVLRLPTHDETLKV